jgi:hypothetical protein
MDNMDTVRHPQGFLDGLTQPLDQPDAFSRIAICSLIAMIPVVNLVYLAGYKMEIMKRVAQQNEHFLPDPTKEVISIFLEGLRMVFMGFIYYLIPLIGLWMADLGVIQHLLEFDQVFKADNFGEFAKDLLDWCLGLLGRMLLFIVWDFLMDPIYMSAKMRYARTGRLSTFLNIPGHALEALRNITFHFKAMAFSLFFWLGTFVVEGLMSVTVVGGLLFPFIVAALYAISTGYEYGAYAQKQT